MQVAKKPRDVDSPAARLRMKRRLRDFKARMFVPFPVVVAIHVALEQYVEDIEAELNSVHAEALEHRVVH